MSEHDPYAAPDNAEPDVSYAEADTAPEPAALVPSGGVREVTEWIGEDKERAKLARDAENAAETPRKGVIKYANELLGE